MTRYTGTHRSFPEKKGRSPALHHPSILRALLSIRPATMTAEHYVQITIIFLIMAPKDSPARKKRKKKKKNGPKGKSNNAKGRSLGTCKKADCLQILGSSTVHTGRCYNACSVDINLECTLRNSGDYCIWNICLHKPHTLQNVPEFYEMSPTIRKHRCESAPGLQAKTPWLIIHSSGHPEHQY